MRGILSRRRGSRRVPRNDFALPPGKLARLGLPDWLLPAIRGLAETPERRWLTGSLWIYIVCKSVKHPGCTAIFPSLRLSERLSADLSARRATKRRVSDSARGFHACSIPNYRIGIDLRRLSPCHFARRPLRWRQAVDRWLATEGDFGQLYEGLFRRSRPVSRLDRAL